MSAGSPASNPPKLGLSARTRPTPPPARDRAGEATRRARARLQWMPTRASSRRQRAFASAYQRRPLMHPPDDCSCRENIAPAAPAPSAVLRGTELFELADEAVAGRHPGSRRAKNLLPGSALSAGAEHVPDGGPGPSGRPRWRPHWVRGERVAAGVRAVRQVSGAVGGLRGTDQRLARAIWSPCGVLTRCAASRPPPQHARLGRTARAPGADVRSPASSGRSGRPVRR